MKSNPVVENVLGTMGTICWTGQLIPQVWKNYRDKTTVGLSPWMMLLWGISAAFLGVYSILRHLNVALRIQPQLFGFLALLSWGQCLYYNPHRSRQTSVITTTITMAIIGGVQVLLVFVTRPAYERGVSAPVTLYGVLSAVLIGSGLLPQYWEIYRLKEVQGISYTFILIDMLGGLLSDLSLAFAGDFDGLAAASYTLVVVMDSVIILAAIILNPRARKRRRLATAVADSDSAFGGEENAYRRTSVVSLAAGTDGRSGDIERGGLGGGCDGQPLHGASVRKVYDNSPSSAVVSSRTTPGRGSPIPTPSASNSWTEKSGQDKSDEDVKEAL